jgi:hypothetical protein
MKIKIIIISLPVFLLLHLAAWAKPVVAFGYISNVMASRELNYLEFIFTNSLANSIKAVFDVDVEKPADIEKKLVDKGKTLKKDYEIYELPDLIKDIKSDFFIFGSFEPVGLNLIKIHLNLYAKGQSRFFSFTNTGRMETQVSRIIDRITIIIITLMGDHNIFKSAEIRHGSTIALLTNIEGEDQNILLAALMKRGYRVVCVGNNELHSMISDDSIDLFSYIRTSQNTFDAISDWRKSEFYYGTWTGPAYDKTVKYIRYLFDKYDTKYDLIKENTLRKLNDAFDNRIDVLLIVGFSGWRSSAWVRAIDMKEYSLIWMESDIDIGLFTFNKIAKATDIIMNDMTSAAPDPFAKHGGKKK